MADNLAALYRSILAQRLTGHGGAADDFRAHATRAALAGARSIGASTPGLAPAAAARQAQNAAAQSSIGVGAQAAQMREQEQAQALPLAQRQVMLDQQRGDRFLGAGLQAGGTALSQLLAGLGGGGQQRQGAGTLGSVAQVAAPIAGMAVGGPVGGAAGSAVGSAIPALLGGGDFRNRVSAGARPLGSGHGAPQGRHVDTLARANPQRKGSLNPIEALLRLFPNGGQVGA